MRRDATRNQGLLNQVGCLQSHCKCYGSYAITTITRTSTTKTTTTKTTTTKTITTKSTLTLAAEKFVYRNFIIKFPLINITSTTAQGGGGVSRRGKL